ncbi:MAG: signal peptidase I [Erythrobacter sp.]|uniref:signal peptidase I n=1 Tax=Erythrobacter sp. TaxID=1042 RepID=UPI00329804AE
MDGKAHTQESASSSSLQSHGESANTSALVAQRAAKKETPKSFALFLIQLLIAVLIFRSFIFAPFSIPSESMLPRLMNGDLLLAAKWPYGFSNHSLPFDAPIIPGRIFAGEPERGDIVIFKHPVDGADYIKRVIALPGDRIAVVDGVVILNGAPLPLEPLSDFAIELSPNTGCAWGGHEERGADDVVLCRYAQYRETLPGGREFNVLDFGSHGGDNFAATIIPDGHMFVMGDSRDNSRDSRFAARGGDAVGIVNQDLLVGEASIILWSSDGSAVWYNPISWFSTVRWDRIGTLL